MIYYTHFDGRLRNKNSFLDNRKKNENYWHCSSYRCLMTHLDKQNRIVLRSGKTKTNRNWTKLLHALLTHYTTHTTSKWHGNFFDISLHESWMFNIRWIAVTCILIITFSTTSLRSLIQILKVNKFPGAVNIEDRTGYTSSHVIQCKLCLLSTICYGLGRIFEF